MRESQLLWDPRVNNLEYQWYAVNAVLDQQFARRNFSGAAFQHVQVLTIALMILEDVGRFLNEATDDLSPLSSQPEAISFSGFNPLPFHIPWIIERAVFIFRMWAQ